MSTREDPEVVGPLHKTRSNSTRGQDVQAAVRAADKMQTAPPPASRSKTGTAEKTQPHLTHVAHVGPCTQPGDSPLLAPLPLPWYLGRWRQRRKNGVLSSAGVSKFVCRRSPAVRRTPRSVRTFKGLAAIGRGTCDAKQRHNLCKRT